MGVRDAFPLNPRRQPIQMHGRQHHSHHWLRNRHRLALAKCYAARGNRVIISGRRPEALRTAKHDTRASETPQADVSTEAGRVKLVKEALARFPDLNVLVNNAGIQNRPARLSQSRDWPAHRTELATNLDAPLHLTILLLPHLATAAFGSVLNGASGLAFAPSAIMPASCLTKAALHLFTLSLRHQLKDTCLDVVEIVPPAVNTDLDGPGLHTFGADLDAFADTVFGRLDLGKRNLVMRVQWRGAWRAAENSTRISHR
jgi:uncharacterized oxidoreductase